MSFIIAADTGGTFTDLAAIDLRSSKMIYKKSLTTYHDFVEGVMSCLDQGEIDLADAELMKFGTTLVINTYVQRNGARTALVTTKGFRDTIEIRRGNRNRPFDLRYDREPPLSPRELRLEVNERIDAKGNVLVALTELEIDSVAKKLSQLEVEAVAISLLNSYINDIHERALVDGLTKRLPDIYVTSGSSLSREWYEFERTSTAVANAYVGPALKRYVTHLHDELAKKKFSKSFFMMASNGGVFGLKRAQSQPVMLVESGPVGGCIGAGVYAQHLGIEQAIAFDMGGTTAKCALLENGVFDVKSPYFVGGESRGFPVRGGVLDIVEVGTGGGSIASIDKMGNLIVGPRSAGSKPGPVCYAIGGQEPTITDANLVLGRIGASSFLGGAMQLDIDSARKAISSLGDKLGMGGADRLDELANGILKIGSIRMSSAINQIALERGFDPRELSIIAFGGGGPLHCGSLARELNIREVVVPPEPGVFSALGMLMADPRVDETETFISPLTGDTVAPMHAKFEAMEKKLAEDMSQDIGQSNTKFERQVEVKYAGQRHAIKVRIVEKADVASIREAFEKTYLQRYGRSQPDADVEIVSLVLTARAGALGIDLRSLNCIDADADGKSASARDVYFDEIASRIQTPIFKRSSLPVGFAAEGPALIEEYGSTTVVGPFDSFRIGELGEIRITFKAVKNG